MTALLHRSLTALLFLALNISLYAAPTVIFDNTSGHPGGSLTFGTSTAPATAKLVGGAIDAVTKINFGVATYGVTAAGIYDCGSPTSGFGCIELETGSYYDESTVGNTTTYRYNPGGFLHIFGTANGASGLLYMASAGFDGLVALNVNNTTNLASMSGTLSSGWMDSILAASLGIDTAMRGGTDANSAFSISFLLGSGSGSVSTNSVQLNPVPEPATMGLMGLALAGGAFYARRRRRKQC